MPMNQRAKLPASALTRHAGRGSVDVATHVCALDVSMTISFTNFVFPNHFTWE